MEQSSDIFFVNRISFWTFFKDRQSSSSLTSDGNSVILFYKPAWNMTEAAQFREEPPGILLVGF